MRSYRDSLTPRLDPITGKSIFPLSFHDRAAAAPERATNVVPMKRGRRANG